MEKVVFVILIFWVQQAAGQSEDSKRIPVVDSFQSAYNKGSYDSIFFSFSSTMRQHLPLDKTQEFFQRLDHQAGNILERKLISASLDKFRYKLIFERGIYSMDLSLDTEDNVSGFLINPFVDEILPKLERNISSFILPFKDSWTVVWGGDTRILNYHLESRAQKNAFDFVLVGRSGKTYRTDGLCNEDYYAFGQEIIAPCEGKVVLVVDGVKDNIPGEMNPTYVPGNTVVLKTSKDEYLFFAHFKQYSIEVTPGEIIRQGQLIGQCGNSGNSSEPHLHFHLQNVEDLNKATGAKSFFKKIMVNGEIKYDHSPQKGEVVKPVDE